MATHRMLPPANAAQGPNPCVVNGRLYTCALGATIDVADFDAAVLQANGWTMATNAGSGTTAQRPAASAASQPLKRGTTYNDTTVGKVIMWDGATWRDHTSGAAV